ncbi:retrovirus-related pol polyprotein from transposon TNT 1-94 [Tanacetum coccineum]
MEGGELTNQERESKLANEFDRFTLEKGETIQLYFMRYSKLINDINIIVLNMTKLQVNTKFVNHLQPEWSRFVTRVKRAGNLHNVSFDQLYAYLKHNEVDTSEVQAMRAKFRDPFALIAKNYNPSPSYSTLAIASRYPPTNNHLRFFSNLRIQANVQDGRVIVQNVQGRHSQGCYNYKGEGHYAKKCTKKKRVKDSKWFKDKMLLAQKQEARLELDDEEQDFMADELEGFDSVYEGLQLNTTSIFMTNHVDAFGSDCDEAPISSAIFITRLSPTRSVNGDDVGPFYDTDILSEVPNYDNYHDNDMFHQFVQDLDYSEQSVSVNDTFVALTNDNHVISEIPYAGSNKNEVIQDMNSLAQNDAEWEIDVNTCSMEKKYFEIEKKELSLENYRLLEESLSCDIMCKILRSVKDMDVYSVFSCMFIDKTVECEILEAELSKLKENVENKSFNDLLKRFAKLEKYSISLELSLQHHKEKMICNGSWKWHDASLISELKNQSYEINDLKAQLQDKSIAVNELKKLLTKLKGKGMDT